MAIKIIDNKRVEMTNDEWNAYQKICESYDDPPAQRGRDLFVDMFETNEEGIIIFLKPAHHRMTTFEAFFFLSALMQHQHLRRADRMIAVGMKKVEERLQMVDDKLAKLEREQKEKSTAEEGK